MTELLTYKCLVPCPHCEKLMPLEVEVYSGVHQGEPYIDSDVYLVFPDGDKIEIDQCPFCNQIFSEDEIEQVWDAAEALKPK